MEVKRLVRIFSIFCAILILFPSCESNELDYSLLERKWYLTDYPLYRDCDVGSWISLEADDVTRAQILCSNSQRIITGTWSRVGNELYIDNQDLVDAGLGSSGTIKSLSASEMKYATTVTFGVFVDFPVTVIFTAEMQD